MRVALNSIQFDWYLTMVFLCVCWGGEIAARCRIQWNVLQKLFTNYNRKFHAGIAEYFSFGQMGII